MKKLFSSILILVLIISSISFAQNKDYTKVGEELKSLGIIKGQDGGELNENSKLTREQALVVLVRMLGKEDEISKSKFDDIKFKDVPAGNFYEKYIAHAKSKGWTNGISPNLFGFEKNISTKAVATYFMRALGYEIDWSKDDVMKKATELGIMKDVIAVENEDIIRGEVFLMMRNTLNSRLEGSSETLKEKLGLGKKAEFKILDVASKNLVQLEVKLNKEVNEKTLDNVFYIKDNNIAIENIKVSKDLKNLILNLSSPLKNTNTYTLYVKNLSAKDGSKIKNKELKFKSEDLKLPDAQKIEILSPSEGVVVFSEPISKLGEVYLKNDFTGDVLLELKKTQDSTKIKFSGVKLDAGYRYVFEVKGFKDYAGYTNLDKILELKVETIKDAPKIEIKEATNGYVVLEFNRELRGFSKENFYHTYVAWKPIALYRNLEDLNSSNNQIKPDDRVKTLYVEFSKDSKKGTYPLAAGYNKFSIVNSVGTRKVLDNWNNTIENQTLNAKVADDKDIIEVVDVDVSDENQLTIKFSKDVANVTKSNFEFLVKNASSSSNLEYKIKTNKNNVVIDFKDVNLTGQKILVEVKDVQEATILKKKMNEVYQKEIEFKDVVFKGVKEIIRTKKDDDLVFTVVYAENVDTDSAIKTENYGFSIDGVNYFTVEDYLIEPRVKSKSVFDLSFAKEQVDKYKLNEVSMISITDKISDMSGNTIVGFEKSYKVNVKATEFALVKAVAHTPTTLSLYFDSNLYTVDKSIISTDDFVFYTKQANRVPIKVEVADFKRNKENETNEISLVLRNEEGDTVLSSNTNLLVAYKGSQLVTSLGGKIGASNKVEIEDRISPDYKKISVKSLESSIDFIIIKKDAVKFKSASGKDRYKFTTVIKYNEELKENILSKSTYKFEFAPNSFVIDKVELKGSEVNLIFSISKEDYESWNEYIDEDILKMDNSKLLKKTDMKLVVTKENPIEDLKGNIYSNLSKSDVYIEDTFEVDKYSGVKK